MSRSDSRTPGEPAGKTRLVYLLSASHSGSTLLAMVLGSHTEIVTVGELKFNAMGDLNQYRCSCREEIRKCPFWDGITREMAGRGFPFDLNEVGTDFQSLGSGYAKFLLSPLHRGVFLEFLRDRGLSLSASWRRESERIQAKNLALLQSVATRSGKDVVVDSSKVAVRLKYLLRNPAIDVRIVRLVRDGRAVALTYMDSFRFADASDPGLRGGGMGIRGEYDRLSMSEAALEWRLSNEEGENLLKGVERSRWMEVRYETFCREPEKTANAIFKFIGVAPTEILALFRTTVQHVVGNGMRLDSRREIQLDERWRDVLRKEDLAVFESIAGSLNRRLGYL